MNSSSILQSKQVSSSNRALNSKAAISSETTSNENSMDSASNAIESRLKDEWWQLFDAHTKRFYYYNARRELTQWQRPTADSTAKRTPFDSTDNITTSSTSMIESSLSDNTKANMVSSNATTVCLLASRLLALLMSQLDLDRDINMEELLEKTKNRLKQASSSSSSDSTWDRIGKEIHLLESLIALGSDDTLRDQFAQSFNSYLAGSFMSSLNNGSSSNGSAIKTSTNTNTSSSRTPRQPRTNPNYINVSLIDKQNGSLLKNTYMRLQDIPDESAKSDSIAAVFLMALLNNASSSSNQPKQPQAQPQPQPQPHPQPPLQQQQPKEIGDEAKSSANKPSRLQSKGNQMPHHQSGKSLISCFMNTSDIECSKKMTEHMPLQGSATTSLTRKTIEKKFSFLTSTTKPQHAAKSSRDGADYDSYIRSTTTSRQAQAAALAAAAVAAAVAKSTPSNNLDESITTTTALETSSLDLLSDDNATLSPTPAAAATALITNAQSVSSLAGDVESATSVGGGKIRNLRLSFNSTTSTTIVKSTASNNPSSSLLMMSSSSSSQLTDKPAALDKENLFMCRGSPPPVSFKSDDTNTSNGCDVLARKSSESNLLLIKTQIDLNVHHEKKLKSGLGGFLFFSTRKRIADHDLMVWTSQTIEKPLIKTNNKTIKKEACELFKLIQCYMGDRKSSPSMISSTTTTNSQENCNSNNNSLRLKSSKSAAIISSPAPPPASESQNELIINNSPHKDLTALEIMSKGWQHAQLRDELYLQIIKQTTSNLNRASCLLGWQLMALCLSFFPPTQKLYPFLDEYIMAHVDETASSDDADGTNAMLSKLARACLRRLQRIQVTGAKKGLKAPTIEEIILSKNTILQASLFGTTLEEIMCMQRKKCSGLKLPWIQTVLSEAVLRLNGARTEGIFRVPGDLDEVNNLKVKLDQLWCSEQVLGEHEVDIDLMQSIQDPHLPASLLKLWYRELHEPLIPNEFYDECINNCDQPAKCLNVINSKLPEINRLVFAYLIRFLKVFAASDNVAVTKMDANNLSMVMAPNCLRCKSNDPKTIMENTKKEMQFIKTMIQHLDTDIINF